jgi:hypothetical protein
VISCRSDTNICITTYEPLHTLYILVPLYQIDEKGGHPNITKFMFWSYDTNPAAPVIFLERARMSLTEYLKVHQARWVACRVQMQQLAAVIRCSN